MKKAFNALKFVFSNYSYSMLAILIILVFGIIYMFAWNLVLLSNFYVRRDLWTITNIFFLISISILTGLVITLNVFIIKTKINASRSRGFLSIIPALLSSACPSCAPILLSFTSTTFTIGLAIAKIGNLVMLVSLFLLVVVFFYLASRISDCKIND